MAKECSQYFDGFSIGSNDLTQLILGVDRDSDLLSDLFSASDPAVKKMIRDVIASAKRTNTKIGLCGQAPSDDPTFARFLVESGINSISFNPDALVSGIKIYCKPKMLVSEFPPNLRTVKYITVLRLG